MKSKLIVECEELSDAERQALAEALSGVQKSDSPLVFELAFVSEEEIQTLNREKRGVDRVTDVLSFPAADGVKGKKLRRKEYLDCLDEEGRLVMGSIAICKARAKEQAEEYGHSLQRELTYLTVHGVLHCLGYDHMTEEDKREMRAEEEKIMARMNLKRD